MILLDTDNTTLLKYPESQRAMKLMKLMERMNSVSAHEYFGVTIVTVEERIRGWLAVIAKEKLALRQVTAYRELSSLFEFYNEFEVIPFDASAALRFQELRKEKIRIGTRDLKIAAIALVRGALLISSNLRDFKQVPGLRVENWAD